MFRFPKPPVCARNGALGVLLALSAGLAPGQAPKDLADASLEELLNIKVVSAGKKAESLKTSAASVFVITADDIRRSGMHSLPELLRLAPGVQVARTTSGHWAISIRGFNGDFASQLLVMVDGRVVYNEEWDGVYWDMEEMPLANIERIEVVRGPVAAMWGPNAVNGVINILTKNSADTQGGLVTAEAANQEFNTSVRYGGAIGPDATYRVTARYGDASPLPAAPSNPGGGYTSSNGWASDAADFRVDWNPAQHDTFLFTGQAYQSNLGEPTPFVTPQNPSAPYQDVFTESQAGNLLGSWQHTFANGSSLEARVAWDYSNHGMAKLPTTYFGVDSNLQYHFALGSRNDLVWGVEYRHQWFDAISAPGTSLAPDASNLGSYSTFLEDQFTLVPDKVWFIAAVNAGHNAFTGLQIQPTGRLLWTPAKKLTYWAAVSRAVGTPSLIFRGLQYNLGAFQAAHGLLGIATLQGNPTLGGESALAYEAGQRVELTPSLSLDLSAFFNRYSHLMDDAQGVPFMVYGPIPYLELPVTIQNNYYGRSHGLELSADWNVSSHWKWIGGFSWLDVFLHSYPGWTPPPFSQGLNNSPAFQWQLRSNVDLTRKIQLDAGIYYTGSILEDAVPRHLRGDLHLSWRPRDAVEFSAGVQNAFQPYHAELPSQYQGQQLLVRREAYAAFAWHF